MRWRSTHSMVAAVIVVVLFAGTPTLAAEPGDQGTPASQREPNRDADFLFGRPHGSISFRGGWLFAAAGSDLFDFVTRQLTLDKPDFNSPGVGVDIAWALTPRVDTQVGLQWAKMSQASEYRDFVDNQFLPIEQRTTLKTIHVGASVRFALTPRGRDISRFAWVPRRVVPYVGAGAGAVYYNFAQHGDFVDFVDLSVFPDTFVAKGWAPSTHVLGGVDLQMYRALYGTVEGRYTRAAGKLGKDFIDFDPIDLSGFRLSAGITLLF